MEKGTGILMVCTFGDQTDVVWWRENKLPLRQLFGSDGKVLEINFDHKKEKNEWISVNAEKANKNIYKFYNKTLKQSKNLIIEMLKESQNSLDNIVPLVSDPKKISHPVRYYEKGDSPIEYLSSRQWFIKDNR